MREPGYDLEGEEKERMKLFCLRKQGIFENIVLSGTVSSKMRKKRRHKESGGGRDRGLRKWQRAGHANKAGNDFLDNHIDSATLHFCLHVL